MQWTPFRLQGAQALVVALIRTYIAQVLRPALGGCANGLMGSAGSGLTTVLKCSNVPILDFLQKAWFN